MQSYGPLSFTVTLIEQSSGVPMPTLSLQLSRSEMANTKDSLLSKRLPSPDAISAVIPKNAGTANYGCDAVSTMCAFLGQSFQWTALSKAPGTALGAGMLSDMAEVHQMNV